LTATGGVVATIGAIAGLATLPGRLLIVADFDGTLVIPGYVARDPQGVQTTLGRNGSDFSASIFGALLDAASAQRAALARIDELIARLAEWDNFQSVLNLARDILHRQKSLRDRTKESLEGR